MKYIVCVAISCLMSLQTISAQIPRGLGMPIDAQVKPDGKTYALIVGISKYKNHDIPSLKYADKDAVAFENYLAANGVDSNNITLMLNENATNGKFWSNLNFITDLAKQNDKVYIYFSGHGDVENKTVVKDAYLLAFDAPTSVYPSGGAIGVNYLKSWIATLSAKGVAVIFIADACHSGTIAGGTEGMEAAAAILKENWQDEIKILSCQPGEFSQEGLQWGNGRGLFSYELIKGLSGLADRDRDGKVTLHELNLYLTQIVPDQAKPLPQYPMVQGNMRTTLSNVNLPLILESDELSNRFTALNIKGNEKTLLKNLPDSIIKFYDLFNTYLDSSNSINGHLLYKSYSYLTKIPESDSTKMLLALMKRNFTATFLSEMDRIIDEMMTKKNYSVGNDFTESMPIEMVETARNFLGDGKLHSLGYFSKVLYFEGLEAIFQFKEDKFTSNMGLGRMKIDSAIANTPNAAYLYYSKANFHLDTAIATRVEDYKKAIELSPHFISALGSLPACYIELGMPDSVIYYSSRLADIDSVFKIPSLAYKSIAYYMKNDTLAGIKLLDSALFQYQAQFSLIKQRDTLAVSPVLIAVRPDTSFTLRFRYYKRVIGIADQFSDAKLYRVSAYLMEPLSKVNTGFGYMPKGFLFQYYLKLDLKEKCLYYLDEVLKDAFSDQSPSCWKTKEYYNTDDYAKIRNEPKFKALMKKYFPDKPKH